MCVLCIFEASAQQFVPIGHEQNQVLDAWIQTTPNEVHTSVKPYVTRNINTDSLLYQHRTFNGARPSWLARKMRYDNLIGVHKPGFVVVVNPLMDFMYGSDLNEKADYYTNTRGIQLKGRIGSQLEFYTDYYENQARFPDYLNDFIQQYKVIPGQGMARAFEGSARDYAHASGGVSYTPSQYFNFAFGHGKQFIGDGYRSLLLSDNAFMYPYLRITTNVWKLQYTCLWVQYQDLQAPKTYVTGNAKKNAAYHVLSSRIGNWAEWSLFDAVVWQARDTAYYRGFELNYMNPIIFYHPVNFSLGSPDNAIIGSNLKLKPFKKVQLYGQLVIDDMDIARTKKGKGFILNKIGWQAGYKWFDFLYLPGLYAQTEYNRVRPYTYSHRTQSQSYTHYNQALAHPLGANFSEWVNFLTYRYKDITLSLQYNYAIYGEDSVDPLTGVRTNWGKDLFQTEYDAERGYPSNGTKPGDGFGNVVGQGIETTLHYFDAHLNYMLNPRYNLHIGAGFSSRVLHSALNHSTTQWWYLSLSTTLFNRYYDF